LTNKAFTLIKTKQTHSLLFYSSITILCFYSNLTITYNSNLFPFIVYCSCLHFPFYHRYSKSTQISCQPSKHRWIPPSHNYSNLHFKKQLNREKKEAKEPLLKTKTKRDKLHSTQQFQCDRSIVWAPGRQPRRKPALWVYLSGSFGLFLFRN